jgi:cis-L-3-hydroxyproline dehydratase
MPVTLTDNDQLMLDGDLGPAPQMAMSILARMAEIYRASELLDINRAHIDSTIYLGEANLEFAERLAALGARVSVPTTLNVSGLDEFGWREWDVPQDWAAKAHRQMMAYQSMGAIPTWTCAPYQTEYKPSFGEQIAWGESNAIAFANSVIGARTNRYPDLLDICCAITGRAPAYGLHLDQNRAGQLLLQLDKVPIELQRHSAFFAVLGHLMGRLSQDRIPVIHGLDIHPTEDDLKAMCAAGASSGVVALFHIIGVTPEAPTFQAAFHGNKPEQTIAIDKEMLRQAYRELTTTRSERLDMVVLGSPHFSLAEFDQLSPLINGQHVHPQIEFLITTNRAVVHLMQKRGLLQQLQEFGVRLTVDTCILATPMLPERIKTIMTNSPKYAYYSPGMLNRQVVFAGLEDCVRSAVSGKVIIEDTVWS